MANETKKYASLENLQTFKENLDDKFATKTDLDTAKNEIIETVSVTVDSILSPTSVNPVQNKVIDAEFEAVSTAMNALESEIDAKIDTSTVSSTYETKTDAQNKLDTAKSYTDTKTSGLASTTSVESLISTHNTSTSAHNDIRVLITDLTTKLNNFLDVDDTTSDQLSEVLTLIENNKGTLESLTSSKINVSDIVNNLTTNSADKVLSAAQGVAIKNLIDALQTAVDGKAPSSHTHNYAGSSSAGGAANSAEKATNDGDGNKISDTYLKKSGGKMQGPIQWNSKSMSSSTNLIYLVGIEAFADGGTMKYINASNASVGSATKATQDASGNVITSTYATKNELSGKANSSHGNHVPATETANNAKFLRNDNTWQTVTPANIGAAKATNGDVTNCNTALDFGKYNVTSATQNAPVIPKNGDVLFVIPWDINTIFQIYAANAGKAKVYYRFSYIGDNTTWASWECFATTGYIDNTELITTADIDTICGNT